MIASNKRRPVARGISAAALIIALISSTPALAQAVSTIRGRAEGVTAGTQVVVIDTATGQRATTTVGADGSFVVVGLRPSRYTVQLGEDAPQEVIVPVGEVVTVDFSTAPESADVPSGTGDEIVVTGNRGRAEVRTATVATSVSQAQIENLPQNDRNFLNFAALAPGVTVSADPQRRQVQAGGVSSDNVNVFIDGQSYKNQVGHGGVAGQSFSQGNPFPQLAIQEFRVETQNFKAEYEQAGSAIINAATKVGGQEFHGEAFVQYVPKSFFGRPFFDRPGNANNLDGSREKPDYKRLQYGAALGGPIFKDRLHFFAAFEGTSQTNPARLVDIPAPVPEAIRSAENGIFGASFTQSLAFGKLTFFATDRDTINLTVYDRSETDNGDYGNRDARSHARELVNTMRVYQGHWQHRGDAWLNELNIAYQKLNTGQINATEGPEIVLTNGSGRDTNNDGMIGEQENGGNNLANLGAHFFQQDAGQEVFTFKNDVTFSGGSHVVKAGVKFAHNKYDRTENWYVNGSYFFDANGFTSATTNIPWKATVSVNPSTPAEETNNQLGLYVQDDWTINDNWTLNVGLRWDYETNMFNNKYVTPAALATALRNYPGWKAAGIDPENYISDGSERKAFLGAFQPRLGISYDVFGDRDLVFFAGAGRYYDRNLFNTAQIERLTNDVRSDTTIVFGQNGAPAWNERFRDVETLRGVVAGLRQGGNVWLLADDTPVPFTDQFNFGVRKRFGEVQTSLAFAYNRSQDRFQYVRGNRLSNGTYTSQGDFWIQDLFPGPDDRNGFLNGQLAGYNGKLNIGSSRGAADYKAVYLTVDKPFTELDGYGFTGSLTVSDARSNNATELGSDEFFAGPNQTQFGWQPIAGLERYRFVGTGIVAAPWGTTLSTTITAASGPRFGFVRFPANPPENACCTANFGGVKGPRDEFAFVNVDARVAKTFETPWGHEITADLGVFNLFDAVNRQYTAWGAGQSPRLEENATTGNARTFQAGLKYKF